MVQNLKSGSCLLVEISIRNLDGFNEVFYFKALLGLMPSGFYFNATSTHPGECSSREAHGIFSVEIERNRCWDLHIFPENRWIQSARVLPFFGCLFPMLLCRMSINPWQLQSHETAGVNHDFLNQTLWHLKFEFSIKHSKTIQNLLLIFVLRPFFCVPRPKNWKL